MRYSNPGKRIENGKRMDEDESCEAVGLIWLSMLDMGCSTRHISSPWRDTPGISRAPHERRTSLRDSISTSLCRMCSDTPLIIMTFQMPSRRRRPHFWRLSMIRKTAAPPCISIFTPSVLKFGHKAGNTLSLRQELEEVSMTKSRFNCDWRPKTQ